MWLICLPVIIYYNLWRYIADIDYLQHIGTDFSWFFVHQYTDPRSAVTNVWSLMSSYCVWRVGHSSCSMHLTCTISLPKVCVHLRQVCVHPTAHLRQVVYAPLPSARQYPSYDDCLEVKREYYQNSSVLDCVTQCSQSAAHLYEQFLQVKQIGFVTWTLTRCIDAVA